jgi:hypothetical protein
VHRWAREDPVLFLATCETAHPHSKGVRSFQCSVIQW